ncbi:MAG: phosphotransferase [Blastochloris sp.]|nr:phosphotransferase [Blastochloris sp.]
MNILSVTLPARAEPAWLTAALRAAGALPQGEVVGVEVRDNPAFNSQVRHLTLHYTADAPMIAPQALVLKTLGKGDGTHEVEWYRFLMERGIALPMLPTCFLALADAAGGESALLLNDLSATHAPPVSRADILAHNGVPVQADLELMLVALAQFHATFWEHPALASGPEFLAIRPWYRDEAHFARHVERRQREWAAFIAADHDWPPPAIREVYAQVLADLPTLWQRGLGERVSNRRALTISHGDCYLTQWLCPRAAGAAGAYLVDFDSVGANYAAYDLVYMLATFWTWAQRRDAGHELAALKLYHDALEAAGVNEYRWEQLCDDYELMLRLMILTRYTMPWPAPP